MSNDSMATVSIGKDIVTPIIEAKIQASIVEALKGTDHLIENAVSRALTQKGKDRNGYTSDKSVLQLLTEEAIQEQTRKALAAWMEQKQTLFLKQIEASLKRQAPQIAEALCDGLAERIKSTYATHVSVQFKKET